MKALVVYDSLYGNTEKIAKAIAANMGEEAVAMKATEVKPEDIAPYFYIVIGSPTQGGRYSPGIATLLDNLTPEGVKEKRFAVFDTRTKGLIPRLFGWASPKIETAIRAKHGNVIAPPNGFFVKNRQGPLAAGEIARAEAWGKRLATR